jgi:NADPH:quinone reductase-like Zn-dependent oxidoreductase
MLDNYRLTSQAKLPRLHRRGRRHHVAEDFTSSHNRWDVIFDVGGNRPFSRCWHVMEPNGILVAIGWPVGRSKLFVGYVLFVAGKIFAGRQSSLVGVR